jgi:hypothetical protein
MRKPIGRAAFLSMSKGTQSLVRDCIAPTNLTPISILLPVLQFNVWSRTFPMATAVSGRWPRAASADSLAQANPQALIGQSPLPLLAPNPHSAFRISLHSPNSNTHRKPYVGSRSPGATTLR